MALVTENGTRYLDYWGKTPIEITDITVANSGDTFVSEFASVKSAIYVPTTAIAGGATISGKTVTLLVAASSGQLHVFGDSE